MGPSVKFVSPNKGLISKKKMGVNFVLKKRPYPGGWRSKGGLAKDHTFSRFFFGTLPLGCLTSVASSAPPRGFPPVWAVSYRASPSGGGRWGPGRWARSPSSLPGCPWQTFGATARSLTSGCSLREEYELKHWRTEAHKPKANMNMRTEN